MKYIRSIKFKIFFILTLVLSCLIFFVFLYGKSMIRDEFNKYLNEQNKIISSIIKDNTINEIVTLDYEHIKYIIDTFKQSYFKNIYILNKEGYIIAQQASNKIVYKKYPNFEDIKKRLFNGSFQYAKELKLAKNIIGYVVIINDEKNHNRFVLSKEMVLKKYFIMMLIFCLAIAFILSHFMTKPIRLIAAQLKKQTPNLKRFYTNDDEFGYLVSSIDENTKKISNINKNLEKEVHKQTNELKELNKTLESRIEDEVRKNREKDIQLFESSKLASMGEMIGNIAHQWRQPLSVISTASSGMKLRKEFNSLKDEEFFAMCDAINENAQYLSTTIEDFKNFIKGDRKKSKFLLSDNLNSFLHLVEGSIKMNEINIIKEFNNNIEVSGYENELKQCFINLFNNAKDALKNNTKKFIFIRTFIENDKVMIEFIDNAGGIPENILPKVFEPYFTTKHQSKGTGLGLHMTYKLIVEGMGGNIKDENISYKYDNEIYFGARFLISLPKE